MNLSIIIVNWNTRDLLAQCLASVYDHPPACNFEVIVVDNGSADGSVDMVRERFPQVTLIENVENVGFARANNLAIQQSQSDAVLLLNSDTIFLPNTINPLLDLLASQPVIGACGPLMLNADGSFQSSYARFPTLLRESIHQFGLARRIYGAHYPSVGPEDSREMRSVDWVGGACLLVRRTCLEQVGLLDELFVMYGEEMDWCYRMRLMGWDVAYSPAANVIHLGGQSAAAVPVWKYVQIQRGQVRFFRNHYGPISAWTLAIAIRLSSLAKAATIALLTPFMKRNTVRNRSRLHAYWTTAWSRL